VESGDRSFAMATLLDGKMELELEPTAGGVLINLPAEAPDGIASVIRLE
jgi:hypothetical protein